MKFIHAADIHLDSPLVGLERYDGAPVEELRGASRRAFANLVRLAVDEAADFVLIAGDLYDGTWRDYNTGLYFARQMGELNRHGIRVFLVSGNHDAANRMSRDLRLPDNVHLFTAKGPETITDSGLALAVHGQSYRSAELRDNLAVGFPAAVPGYFNIGLLHTGVTGRPGHADYAPCTLEQLIAKGYDYWALGHIHAREELSRAPWVVMPGNTQGRHIRETGAKGCTLVTVAHGEVQEVAHRELDVVRWARVEVETGGAATAEEALDRAVAACEEAVTNCGDRLLAARLEFVGSGPAHARFTANEEQWRNELRAMLLGSFGVRLWAEKILFKTTSALHIDELADSDAPLAQLLHALHASDDAGAVLATERAEIDKILTKIPAELRDQLELPDLDDQEQVRTLFGEIRAMLLPLLLADGEGL